MIVIVGKVQVDGRSQTQQKLSRLTFSPLIENKNRNMAIIPSYTVYTAAALTNSLTTTFGWSSMCYDIRTIPLSTCRLCSVSS